ncbi:hypothetical protein NL676_012421 [Syzygium grande]|nr:hypothetical protein NL676_012421 [Syzygium grande]
MLVYWDQFLASDSSSHSWYDMGDARLPVSLMSMVWHGSLVERAVGSRLGEKMFILKRWRQYFFNIQESLESLSWEFMKAHPTEMAVGERNLTGSEIPKIFIPWKKPFVTTTTTGR